MLRRSTFSVSSSFLRCCSTTTPDTERVVPLYSGMASSKRSTEIRASISQITEEILRPCDKFEQVPKATYQAPMVLCIGNHSSGKSSFINKLLGQDEQQTGVAPTDDGFTVITRGDINLDEDGPSAVSNPRLQFADLKQFNQNFVNRFKLKVRHLPDTSQFPEGMMIIDSPGMIDTPGHTHSRTSVDGQGRGYDFLKVTEWMARRSDVILLFFDPANPGTTGETLDVLTKSLAGMEHKFLILMNKVDMFDKVTDFARAYGTICWNLSKVIQMKDIPRIYTTYTPLEERPVNPDKTAVPVKEMDKARKEVLEEVLRAPLRRLDNLITEMEEAAQRVTMSATVCSSLRRKYRNRMLMCYGGTGAVSFTVPLALMMGLPPLDLISLLGIGTVSLLAAGGSRYVALNHLKLYAAELTATVDTTLREIYPGKTLNHDVAHRWERVVRPAILDEIQEKGLESLPHYPRASIKAVESVITNSVPQLREEVNAYKEEAVRALR